MYAFLSGVCNRLTDVMCKRAVPGVTGKNGKQPGALCHSRLFDGQGLDLDVAPSGYKSFRQTYRINGTKRVLVQGPYPLLSLAEARVSRDETRRLLAGGKDPVSVRRAKKTVLRKTDLCSANIRSGRSGPERMPDGFLTLSGSRSLATRARPPREGEPSPNVTHSNWLCRNCDWIRLISKSASVASC
jgi:hypothetical protein